MLNRVFCYHSRARKFVGRIVVNRSAAAAKTAAAAVDSGSYGDLRRCGRIGYASNAAAESTTATASSDELAPFGHVLG